MKRILLLYWKSCSLKCVYFIFIFILPHHKYNESNKNRKNRFNNGEETQRNYEAYINYVSSVIVFSSFAVISSVSTWLITKTKVWLTGADDASGKDNVDKKMNLYSTMNLDLSPSELSQTALEFDKETLIDGRRGSRSQYYLRLRRIWPFLLQ